MRSRQEKCAAYCVEAAFPVCKYHHIYSTATSMCVLPGRDKSGEGRALQDPQQGAVLFLSSVGHLAVCLEPTAYEYNFHTTQPLSSGSPCFPTVSSLPQDTVEFDQLADSVLGASSFTDKHRQWQVDHRQLEWR